MDFRNAKLNNQTFMGIFLHGIDVYQAKYFALTVKTIIMQ